MLLTPTDPNPVIITKGLPTYPLIFTAEHAGNRIPQALDNLGLAPEILGQHIAYDLGTLEMTTNLAKKFGASCVQGVYSRLVVDCNRVLGDPTMIAKKSDGICIPGNQRLSDQQQQERIKEIYNPFHTAVSHQIKQVESTGITPIFISVHSFTPKMSSSNQERPWDIGLLWDQDDRIAMGMAKALNALDPNLVIGINAPYDLRICNKGSVHIHALSRGIPYVEIEVNQRCTGDIRTIDPVVDALYEAIGTAVSGCWARDITTV